jgi:hypothetical protein
LNPKPGVLSFPSPSSYFLVQSWPWVKFLILLSGCLLHSTSWVRAPMLLQEITAYPGTGDSHL